MPNPRPRGPRMAPVVAVIRPAAVGRKRVSYTIGASPSVLSVVIIPADTQGPKILRATSPRADVVLGSDPDPDAGTDREIEPATAMNERGWNRIPASALVVARNPSCSTNPLSTPREE